MSGLAKFLWGAVSLAIAIAIGYYVLKNEHVLNFAFPKTELGDTMRTNFEKGREWVADKISFFTGKAVEKGTEAVSGVLENAKVEVNGVIDKAKQGAIDSVRKTLNEKFDAAVGTPIAGAPGAGGGGSVIGAPVNSLAQVFPLGFSVKKSLPAVFILKNTASGGAMPYEIFWGDSKSEAGNIIAGDAKTLFHIWEATGEFFIKVVTGTGSAAKTYSSYILVY